MIDESTLHGLKLWFEDYVKRFDSHDATISANINLKKLHTKNVCLEIAAIANSLDLTHHDLLLAEVLALFHDVGRFDQYARYHTFDDARSENHAMLGAGILNREGVLADIDKESRKLILDVVRFHNRAEIPLDKDPQCVFFLKLLRDADKIDIWRIVTEHYEKRASAPNTSIELNLPDTPEISPKIVEDLLAGRIARTKNIQTLNDFKLLQMGWVFDLNFPHTFAIAAKRRYIDRIHDTLPDSLLVTEIYGKTKAYLRAGCPAACQYISTRR